MRRCTANPHTHWASDPGRSGRLPDYSRISIGVPYEGLAPVGLRLALAALTDLDDGAVEHDVSVPLGQRAFLLDRIDLRVAGQQHRSCSRLPGQDRLRPERRVVLLARLGAEHRQLTGRRLALDQVDLGQVLD